MDKKYIEENNLNEAQKRFQQINEYILELNGEAQPTIEQEISQDSEMQQPQTVDKQPEGNEQQELSQDLSNEPISSPDNMQINQSGLEQEEIPTEPEKNTMGDETLTEPAMESDEVIDVDDLTQSQETTEYKLDGVDDKLSQLINIVSKFTQAIEDNDEKINELKKEIEERNPTQQERLNIRSMNGSPYNVTPNEYWTDQNARNTQYNVISNNDVDPDKEEDIFTITDDDIKNFNKKEIEKSINDYPKNLKGYF